MAGKQDKLMEPSQVRSALRRVSRESRYPARDRAILLLSLKAGLRAGEIANLTWPMLLDADGRVGDWLELHNIAAKKSSGRMIPLHPLLKTTLVRLQNQAGPGSYVVASQRNEAMRPRRYVHRVAA